MNNLARLSHVKADVAGVTGTTSDAVYERLIERVSREFEAECGRHFYAYSATRYYQGNSRSPGALRLPHDLISVTSLLVDEDGDGTYELTLASNTDYWLGPYEAAERGEPYWYIELNPNGTQLASWPRYPRSVKLAGLFGYSYELQAAGTLGAAISSTTATSVTMTAGHSVELGDTLIVESEQMYVSAVSSNTLTVTRGINGTTAATHANATAVSVRRYPRDVEEAVMERAVGLRWDSQGGYDMGAPLVGDPAIGIGTRASYARWSRACDRHRRWAVA